MSENLPPPMATHVGYFYGNPTYYRNLARHRPANIRGNAQATAAQEHANEQE